MCVCLCLAASLGQVAEVSGLLQGLEWVVLDDSRFWGVDGRTIDLANSVRDQQPLFFIGLRACNIERF